MPPGRHTVLIKRSAEREMDRLPAPIHARVADAILALEANPRPRGCKKLHGSDEYRLRVGDHRVLDTIDGKMCAVEIVAVRNRRESYRRR